MPFFSIRSHQNSFFSEPNLVGPSWVAPGSMVAADKTEPTHDEDSGSISTPLSPLLLSNPLSYLLHESILHEFVIIFNEIIDITVEIEKGFSESPCAFGETLTEIW